MALVPMLLSLAVYVYAALALSTIAKKLGAAKPWLAWIPFANLFLAAEIAETPWWTALMLIFIGLIPYIGYLAVLGVFGFWSWKIAERRGFQPWIGLLLLVPLVNLVVLGILAWND